MLLMAGGCLKTNSSKKRICFYHWKSKAVFTKSYEKAINISKANKIYLHYFDIETVSGSDSNNDDVFPNYVLKSVAQEFQNFKVIPVVYITNRVFKTKDLDIIDLSNKIKKLTNQISQKHFNEEINEIQIDCDWTQSTKHSFFELLKQLQDHFEIDVTIRLHQIKYKNRTGVPPVKSGTLMLYNMGDLKNRAQNSILEQSIVREYINEDTDYPLPLNVGLPLFSQTVITNRDNEIKIIKHAERTQLENDNHFKMIDKMNFKLIQDTLYKGFFLTKGYNLKLEELNEDEIIASYKIIEESNLIVNEIIFYHLDDEVLSNNDFNILMEQL